MRFTLALAVSSLLFSCLGVTQAPATPLIDTTGGWNGTTNTGPLGANFRAMGQTLTVTGPETVLDDFTLFVNTTNTNIGFINFRAYVMGWNGARAVGPVLYSSALQQVSTGGAVQAFTFLTGGLPLEDGHQYVAFVDTGDPQPSVSGAMGGAIDSSYAGGGFVGFSYSHCWRGICEPVAFDGLTAFDWNFVAPDSGDAPFIAHLSDPRVISASADTYVRSGAPNTNEGASEFLRVRENGDNRALVKFDSATIAARVGTRTVTSAILQMDIADNGNNWGRNGRTVAVHRLAVEWTEGNGREADYSRPESFRGDVPGATWDCAVDSNTANQRPDCGHGTECEMGKPKRDDLHPWVAEPTATALVSNGLAGSVNWDVTADVQAFLAGSAANHGWIIKKTEEGQPGRVDFASRETGHGPRLVITFGPSESCEGNLLYASGTFNGSALFTVSPSSGATTFVGYTGTDHPSSTHSLGGGGLAFDPVSQVLYGLGSDEALYSVNRSTGFATLVGNTGEGTFSGGLAFDTSQHVLYATGQSTAFSSQPNLAVSTLFSIDPATGTATAIGATVNELSTGDLAYDSVRDVLWGLGEARTVGFDRSALYTVNRATGLATRVGIVSWMGSTVDVDLSAGGLAFDPASGTLYATGTACNPQACQSALFTLDPSTAVATLVGPTSGYSLQFGGLEFAPCANRSGL
jgi:hypothetical protein